MRNRTLKATSLLASLLALGLFFSLIAACGSEVADDDSGPAVLDGGEQLRDGGAVPQPTGDPFGDADGGDANRDFNSSGGQGGGAGGTSGGGVGGAGGGADLPDAQILDRQIIRTTTIVLTVLDVPGAVQRIETAATGAGGFIANSSLTVEQQPPPDDPDEEQEVRQRATVTIRVPSENYTGVMNSIRDIVDDPRDITSLTEDTSEVTEEYADLQARLRNLEATEAQYLELLGRAETISDVLLVQDRLNETRLETEQVQGRIQLLDDLTSLATITAQMTLPPLVVEPPQPEPQKSWAREAWDDAWRASEDLGEALGVVAITAGVMLVWLLIPGGLFLGGWWVVTARRRSRGGAASGTP
jgi:hypothetical protein